MSTAKDKKFKKIVGKWAKVKAEDLADSLRLYLIAEDIRIDIKPLRRATIKAFRLLIGVLDD